jgi:hypothetical protein
MTLGTLPFGTTVLYNDSQNVDFRLTIIGHVKDQSTFYVEVLTENGNIETMPARYAIGTRYTIAEN